jgi:outer membrane lipoprotein-sorting protein
MQKTFGRTLTLGAALALALTAGGAQAQQLPTARQIVDRYVEAVGGRQVVAQQRFRRIQAEMSMPAMGATFTMDSKYARPNKFINRMEMPGMGVMTTGFDGQNAWAMNPATGATLMDGKELQQAMRQADFDGAVDFSKAFPTMETVARATVDGKACNRVRMVSAQADTVFGCFDVESGLLTSMEMKQASPMGEMTVTMRMSDYRDFGGMKMPARTTMEMAGQQMVTTVKSVSYEPIPDSEFVPPAEVRALIANRPRN